MDEEKLSTDQTSKKMTDESYEHPKSPPASPERTSLTEADEKVMDGSGGDEGSGSDESDGNDVFKRFRREKRLAMNRASARARRKKKKVMLESLGHQVTELTKKNQSLQGTNETLIRKIDRLETALSQARETIASLLEGRQDGVVDVASALPPSLSTTGLLAGTMPGSGLVGTGLGTPAGLGTANGARAASDPYHSLLLGTGGASNAASATMNRIGTRGTTGLLGQESIYAAALQQQRLQHMLSGLQRGRTGGGLLQQDSLSSLMANQQVGA